MKGLVVLNGVYTHYKGDKYQLLHLAKNESKPSQTLVIYKALYGEGEIWVRPLADFFNKIDANTLRFELFHNDGLDNLAYFIEFNDDSEIVKSEE